MYLAKNKLDCVESVIDHNEFLAIMKEKKDYGGHKNEGDKVKLSEIEIIKKVTG